MSDLAPVLGVLRGVRFNWSSEEELQAGIAEVLAQEGFNFLREVWIGPISRQGGRIDFLDAELRVGIEVKISGSPAAVARQLQRYFAAREVEGLILVTARRQVARYAESILLGERFAVVELWEGGL